MTPYLSYLLADQFLHVSGVLAVVATGLYLGWEAPEALNSAIRLAGPVLLGHHHLPAQRHRLRPHRTSIARHSPQHGRALVAHAAGLRHRHLRDLHSGPPRLDFPRRLPTPPAFQAHPRPGRAARIGARLSSSAGPECAASSRSPPRSRSIPIPNFPRPHLVQFIAFSVILTTLVFQGLTLPALIRFLGVGDDGISAREEIRRASNSPPSSSRKSTPCASKKNPPSALDVVENVYRERPLLQDELADELGWSDRRHHVLSVRRLTDS